MRALALLSLTLLAAPIVHGQKAGLQDNAKCPIKDSKRYENAIKDNKPPKWFSDPPSKEWFAAATTSALHQAAYVFDAPRVECLLTVAKMDPNLKMPVKGATEPLPVQWPLGAAVVHLDEQYSTNKVTNDTIATITTLLKAGADPNIKFYNSSITPLARLTWLTCDDTPPGNCLMAPGVLTIAQALVSAGAEVDPVDKSDGTPLGRLVFGIGMPLGSTHCQEDVVYKQFMDFLISHGADVKYALDGATPLGAQQCPQWFQYLRSAAAAQQKAESSAAAAADTQG